jgi:hypothetical protein
MSPGAINRDQGNGYSVVTDDLEAIERAGAPWV